MEPKNNLRRNTIIRRNLGTIRNENRFRFNSLRLFAVKDDHLKTMTSFVSDFEELFHLSIANLARIVKRLKAVCLSSLPVLCPTFGLHFVTEMSCGRFAGFCSGSDLVILLPRQSADCPLPKMARSHFEGISRVWKTSTLCVACACFSQQWEGSGS